LIRTRIPKTFNSLKYKYYRIAKFEFVPRIEPASQVFESRAYSVVIITFVFDDTDRESSLAFFYFESCKIKSKKLDKTYPLGQPFSSTITPKIVPGHLSREFETPSESESTIEPSESSKFFILTLSESSFLSFKYWINPFP